MNEDQVMNTFYKNLHSIATKMTFPAIVFRNNKWEFVGTSLVCSYNDKLYIINAGHTVEDAMNNNLNLHMMFRDGTTYELSEETRFLNDDNIDIAISPIPDDEEIVFKNQKVCPLELKLSCADSFPLANLIFLDTLVLRITRDRPHPASTSYVIPQKIFHPHSPTILPAK